MNTDTDPNAGIRKVAELIKDPDDPRVRLIRVDIEQAEYWDTPGGKIASLLSMARAAVTGKPDTSNDTGTVQFS